jgi:two-component system OmpR family sensor kinase
MSRPFRMSIRARLTAGTAVVAAVVLSLLAVVVAMQAQQAAESAATQLAVADLRSYAVDIRNQPGEPTDPPASGALVVVVAPDGTVRRASMPAALSAAARRIDRAGEVTVASDEFSVAAQTVSTPDGDWRLWAARDVTASVPLLAGVLRSVEIGTPVAVLLTALTAWFVATAALRPVERMRATAERLRTSGATGTLPVRGSDELAHLGATLNRLIADLRASAAHERRVTEDAAHELRTPLAVLAAQVETAQRRPDRADLPAIRASVDRMGRLADDLLVLSRAEAHLDEHATSPIARLVTEAMDVVDRARVLAPEDVLVDLELGEELDETAVAAMDVTEFGRIITNLVGNALAAGPASSVTVRLRSDGGTLTLEVEDDGPGIPAGFLPFAFDRFSRPEGARRGGSSGAGLGLALVQRLAERAGGSVALRNGDPLGAVATVRLPVR